jgi:hypothetical protein
MHPFSSLSPQFLLFPLLNSVAKTTIIKKDKKVKVKVKQSRYRPGVAQRVPGS